MDNNVYRILIIDDNEDIHRDIKQIILENNRETSILSDLKSKFNPSYKKNLPTHQFVIDSAYQSLEGIKLIEESTTKNPYAVIFVDVRMPPGEDGVQTVKKILEIDDKAQLILCTAFSDYSWYEIFSEVGLTDRLLIIKKPFDVIEIRQLVYSLTTKWELRKKLQRKLFDLNSIVEERTCHLELSKNKLEQIVSLVKATLESTVDGILVINAQKQVLNFNLQFVKYWNLKADPEIGSNSTRLLSLIEQKIINPISFREKLNEIFKNNNAEYFLELKTNDEQVFEFFSRPLLLDDTCIGAVLTFRDDTARRRTANLLLLQDRALQASQDGVFIIDCGLSTMPIIYVNNGFEKITGFQAEKVLGFSSDILLRGECPDAELANFRILMEKKMDCSLVIYYHREDGSTYWGELHFSPVKNNNVVTHFVGIIIDITKRKEMENKILRQANYDALTGLPNRKMGLEVLEAAIAKASSENRMLALLFIDLDRFKMVNDNLGHHIGDKLLNIVSKRINSVLRQTDIVARLGGDEFIVISEIKNAREGKIHVAERIANVFSSPFHVETHELHISPSIGVCFFPKDGKDSSTLMKNADTAMYEAKDEGRNCIKYYQKETSKKILKLDIENTLYHAIEQNQFFLVYQPIFEIKTRQIVGVEALLRWNQPELGILLPQDFLQIAEDTGLIVPIGEWVMQEACNQLMKWQQMGYKDLFTTINLSANQLKNENFLPVLRKILKFTQLNPQHVALELTENFIFESDKIGALLTTLHNLGVQLFIDDFGTGYSNLRYFSQYPIDALKIDKSFIQKMNDVKGNSIVELIISLGKNFKIKVIAEGVEKKEQLEFLEKHACNWAQGFYFAKPLSVEDCTHLLENPK